MGGDTRRHRYSEGKGLRAHVARRSEDGRSHSPAQRGQMPSGSERCRRTRDKGLSPQEPCEVRYASLMHGAERVVAVGQSPAPPTTPGRVCVLKAPLKGYHESLVSDISKIICW